VSHADGTMETETDLVKISQVLTNYADKMISSLTRNVRKNVYDSNYEVTDLCASIAFKNVVNMLKTDGNVTKVNLLRQLVKYGFVGSTVSKWKDLVDNIHKQLPQLHPTYCKAACDWWKFCVHTEAQVSAIDQAINEGHNILLGSTKGVWSLYNPCHSCQKIPWVNNKQNNMWCYTTDNGTKTNLTSVKYKLTANVLYNWEDLRRALCNI
jgi:hypothetical protein